MSVAVYAEEAALPDAEEADEPEPVEADEPSTEAGALEEPLEAGALDEPLEATNPPEADDELPVPPMSV